MIRRILPLFIILIAGTMFALLLLNPAPSTVATIHSLPAVQLTALDGQTVSVPPTGMPAVVNIFASWCVPCAAEMPLLAKLKDSGVPIYGIVYKDKPEAVAAFLARYGNPFTAVLLDDGTASTRYGITGVPESFLVRGDGTVAGHIAGALNDVQMADWQREIAAWR